MFFYKFYQMCNGFHQKVPLHILEAEELILAGRIIAYAFIQHEKYHIELSQAAMEHCLFGNVDTNSLTGCCMEYLLSQEATIIQKFSRKKQ